MDVELVITMMAPDRPGLVAAIAEPVTRHGGNWIDSAMARLGGAFAGIVRVSVAEEKADALLAALRGLAGAGVTISAERAAPPPREQGPVATLSLTCADHPGVVRAVSATLADLGVSIETLETRVFSGSMSGEHLFEAKATIRLPQGADASRVREALETIAADLMADVELAQA
jgi:glycine cleavage system regulatory protein